MTAVNTGARLWTGSVVVAERMVRKFARTPQLIVFTTIQGALFLLMFRFAFGGGGDLRGVRAPRRAALRYRALSRSPRRHGAAIGWCSR